MYVCMYNIYIYIYIYIYTYTRAGFRAPRAGPSKRALGFRPPPGTCATERGQWAARAAMGWSMASMCWPGWCARRICCMQLLLALPLSLNLTPPCHICTAILLSVICTAILLHAKCTAFSSLPTIYTNPSDENRAVLRAESWTRSSIPQRVHMEHGVWRDAAGQRAGSGACATCATCVTC